MAVGKALKFAIALACAATLWRASARADGDDAPSTVQPYARVVVETTSLRSGPGGGFRDVRRAERGEVFPVRERSSRGFWLRVQLPDGTAAWVQGDAVYVYEVGPDEAPRGWGRAFAPPPLMQANGEIPIMLGAIRGGGGFMAVRPTYLLAPTFGFELGGAAQVSTGGRVFMGTLSAVVNVLPDWPVVPFFAMGGGFSQTTPNADTFILQEGTSSLMSAGGGLRIGFKYRIILRAESRAHVFFLPDRTLVQQELSGGLSVFF